jgi:tRNA1Val (adenine37-N6)-methyltransferase
MFTFKQFVVKQQLSAMKVGTDGVLLGSWVETPALCENILDIGTGTGLVALMLAQRFRLPIDAVEIDTDAAFEAKENVEIPKSITLKDLDEYEKIR